MKKGSKYDFMKLKSFQGLCEHGFKLAEWNREKKVEGETNGRKKSAASEANDKVALSFSKNQSWHSYIHTLAKWD